MTFPDVNDVSPSDSTRTAHATKMGWPVMRASAYAASTTVSASSTHHTIAAAANGIKVNG